MANVEKAYVYTLSEEEDRRLAELGWAAADAEELARKSGKPGHKDKAENLQAQYSKEHRRLVVDRLPRRK